MSIAILTLRKYAGEVRAYGFDFSKFPEVMSGETLSSPTVTVSPTGPTIGTPTVTTVPFDPGRGAELIQTGKGVKVSVSAGTAGVSYTLTCTVTTSGGATLKILGTLAVE